MSSRARSVPGTEAQWPWLLAVALTSLALLNVQVTATRLLAYKFFYHFVFFVISMAQLGLAAAGTWACVSPRLSASPRTLVRALSGLAASTLAFLAAYAWLSPKPNLRFAKLDATTAIPYLLVLALVLVAANFCGGLALTLTFTKMRDRIGRLYACDLAGASLGCVAALAAMWLIGPIRGFLASGALAAAAALLLAARAGDPGGVPPRERSGRARPRAAAASGTATPGTLVSLAVLALVPLAGWMRPGVFDPNVRFGAQTPILRSEWTHIARVDAQRAGRYIIDGDASTDLTEDTFQKWTGTEYLLVRPGPAVAIIGVGAGPELKGALAAGASSVLAVDINPSIVKWDLEDDREFNEGIFHRPGVTTVVDDGRHAVRSAAGPFDLIVMYAIDTWTASAQGAYGLTENFLYTSEAIRDYYDKLAPGGVMAVRRWLFHPPRETLRLFTTVHDALGRIGVERPEDHLLVVAPAKDVRKPSLRIWGYLFFSRDPFTPEQLTRMDDLVEKQGWSFLWRPGGGVDSAFAEFVAAADKEAFYGDYPYIVRPSRDANPFFFQFTPPWSPQKHLTRLANVLQSESSTILPVCLMAAVGLTVPLLGIPILLRRRDLSGEQGLAGTAAYFAALGVGFMAFEIPAIQVMTLFLGHPSYALGVVLAGLLAFAGLGSFLSGRLGIPAIRWVLGFVALLGIACGWGLLGAAHALIHLPFALRLLLALGALALAGVPLGMPFATGIRMLDPARPHLVAWAWASNGSASVVGSCVAMLVLVYADSSAAFLLAAACYAAALLIVSTRGWRMGLRFGPSRS